MAAGQSKNSRSSSSTQHFYCSCGGEIFMRSEVTDGKIKQFAECEKCHRKERRPSDFVD